MNRSNYVYDYTLGEEVDEVALGLHNSLEEVVAEVELHGLLCVLQEQIHCVLAVCDLKYINDNIHNVGIVLCSRILHLVTNSACIHFTHKNYLFRSLKIPLHPAHPP